VGFHCPECTSAGAKRSKAVAPSWRQSSDPIVTKVLIGLNAVVFLFSIIGSGAAGLYAGPSGVVVEQGALLGAGLDANDQLVGVDGGEWWRLITGGFLHGGLMHLAFNMLALWILGSMLEPALGRARFVAIYFVSMLAGSFGALLVTPTAITVGASGAIFGLMGAAVALQRERGVDPWRSGLLTLIGINLLITFSIPGISVGGHIGGLVGGAVAGVVAFWLERRQVSDRATVAALAALGVGFAVVGVWAAGTWVDPVFG
jgi:membrane associated rhomboid family serine protease